MKHLRYSIVALCAILIGLSVSRAAAYQSSTWIVDKFSVEEAIQVAVLANTRRIERTVTTALDSYRPLSTEAINRTTDVRILRARLLSAQHAISSTREIIEPMTASQAQASTFNASFTSALATAATAQQLPQAVTYGVGGTRVIALYDTTASGIAPAVPPAVSTACNVMTYVTGAFGTGGPQFISSTGQTVGQKNTLSLIGFALGVVPIAMNCTKDHATSSTAGGKQQQP